MSLVRPSVDSGGYRTHPFREGVLKMGALAQTVKF